MRQILTILLSIFCLTAFSQNQNGQKINNHVKTEMITAGDIKNLEKLNWNFCDTFSIEITGLYPILTTLPVLKDDSTIIKSLLIKNGFTQVDWGTGNWEKGPRFTYLKYEKGSCNCKTFKKYYFIITSEFRVSEKIICNSDTEMDE